MEQFSAFAQQLQEKLMIFGKRAYPKHGHVVIMAGGAGSGKGFQIENLIGIDGRKFDVDEVKKLAAKSDKFAKKVKDETGYDLANMDLRKPENVSRMHDLLASVYGITKKREATAFASILAAPADRKPNLIFDVTLKSISKLSTITRNVTDLGYDKKNIHLVWVVNDIEVAMQQNKSRDRVVPEDILMDTHKGASLTIKSILDMGTKLRRYMDGSIYLSFNKIDVDTNLVKSGRGGSYVKDADYVRVKDQGKRQQSTSELANDIYNKIKDYVPEVDGW